MNKALNNNVKLRKGKKLDKYICKDCNVAYYGYDYALCPYCDSLNSGEKQIFFIYFQIVFHMQMVNLNKWLDFVL